MNFVDKRICSEASAYALRLIKERYEDGLPIRRKAYHNRNHTEAVIARAMKITEALNLTGREQVCVHVASAFHDIVHERGAAGENERHSAYEFNLWAPALSLVKTKLTEAECSLIKQAILATTTAWSAEHGTVIQPLLTPDAHSVVRAVALADMGGPGMEPGALTKDGNDLFAEREVDLIAALAAVDEPRLVSRTDQREYLASYVTWMEAQLMFTKGRKALFEIELGRISEDAKNRMRTLFGHFDESVMIADNNVLRARSITFDELAACLMPAKFQVQA